jgi:hypothetical protein
MCFLNAATALFDRETDHPLTHIALQPDNLGIGAQRTVVPHIVLSHSLSGKAPAEFGANPSAIQLADPTNGGDCLRFIVDYKSSHPIFDDLRHGAVPKRDNWGAASHGVNKHQTKWLWPVG